MYYLSETISSGSFSLTPGGELRLTFSVPSYAVNARLIGIYSVTGGILPLIDVYKLWNERKKQILNTKSVHSFSPLVQTLTLPYSQEIIFDFQLLVLV
jgi:hypothetical protein